MIPPFGERGYLPPGIHPATLDEVDARFGREPELRRAQLASLRWHLDSASRAGVLRVVVNGSFVTDVLEPNEVDCVLLIGDGFPQDDAAEAELISGFPFLELSLVNQADFEPARRRVLRNGPKFVRQRHGGDSSMNLQRHRELQAAREKLRLLEERYEANRREQGGDEHVRKLSTRSIKYLINQLKEEIARINSRRSIGP